MGQTVTKQDLQLLTKPDSSLSASAYVDQTADSRSNNLYLFYKIYKIVFSSQDIPNTCGFYPSCSTYGLHAVRKWGLIIGTLATFDRLQRCNNFHYHDQYAYDETRKKYLDPIDDE